MKWSSLRWDSKTTSDRHLVYKTVSRRVAKTVTGRISVSESLTSEVNVTKKKRVYQSTKNVNIS
jgi:hypothetical protein